MDETVAEILASFARGAKNPSFRVEWVRNSLQAARDSIGPVGREPSLLDVGAGECPYRSDAEDLGFSYVSHDFGKYQPEAAIGGVSDSSWEYGNHDIRCDILDIPRNRTFDVVLCTEVLEHVPRPAEAFDLMAGLVNEGGFLIITAPLQSLLHQAPFWFTPGLSPFWYAELSAQNQIAVKEITVFGDYADLVAQEIARVFRSKVANYLGGILLARFGGAAIARSGSLIRRGLPSGLLNSGGFGVLFIGQKNSSTQLLPSPSVRLV